MANPLTETDKEKAAKTAALEAKEKWASDENGKRKGKGTRIRVGLTRGKSSQVISWEEFDDSQPDTMPTSVKEFMELTGAKSNDALLQYLIPGYNTLQYTAASDPIAEFVNPAWSDEMQQAFRTSVRNYARGLETSIDDAVSLIKPGFDKKHAALLAAEQTTGDGAAPVNTAS